MCEKVLKVVKELNYHPNALARGLKSQRTQVIGILLPALGKARHAAVLVCALRAGRPGKTAALPTGEWDQRLARALT